jgi:protein involved in polysaccharide export with SLBB domain
MKNFLLVISFLLLLPAAALMQDLAKVDAPRGYLVLPGDKIEGKVLGEQEFDFSVQIDDTGKFRVPYFNDTEIDAKCKTESQINAEVKKLVSKMLRDPMVSVRVTERRPSAPVTVSGEVTKPQQVEMRREARLLELIAFSGGFTEDAGGNVQVFRTHVLTRKRFRNGMKKPAMEQRSRHVCLAEQALNKDVMNQTRLFIPAI